jgi:hypothetical protein
MAEGFFNRLLVLVQPRIVFGVALVPFYTRVPLTLFGAIFSLRATIGGGQGG